VYRFDFQRIKLTDVSMAYEKGELYLTSFS